MKSATAVTSTTVVQVLTAFAALTIPSLVPLVIGEAGLHAVDVGTFISILYAAAALVTIFAGHLVQRFGAIRTCQFAVALCAAGLLMARTGSAVGLVVGAVALGLGYGPVTPASSHLLSQSTHFLAETDWRPGWDRSCRCSCATCDACARVEGCAWLDCYRLFAGGAGSAGGPSRSGRANE
jgi:MFS family permease